MEKISLSDGEWKMMNILWENPPKTITQLTAELKAETGWSKHTVITMLNRLEKKKGVYYQEGKKAKQYYPAVFRDELLLDETRGFLDKACKGSLSLLVHKMVEQRSISPEELEELRRVLEQAQAERFSAEWRECGEK